MYKKIQRTLTIRDGRSRRGTVSIEMAMVAPVIFLMVFGSIEFGRMMMVRQALTNAARDGCRNVCLVTTRKSEDGANTVIDALKGVITNATSTDKLNIKFSPAFTSAPDRGTPITTTVEIKCSDVSWLPPFFTAGATIKSSATMDRE